MVNLRPTSCRDDCSCGWATRNGHKIRLAAVMLIRATESFIIGRLLELFIESDQLGAVD
jgi:hypothetical protein